MEVEEVVGEVTSLTLAFLSWDRYRLIVNPLKSLSTRSSKSIYLIMFMIWIVSFLVQNPAAFAPGETPEASCAECGQPWGEELFFAYTAFSVYIVPLIVIVPCYTKIGLNMSAFTASDEASRRRMAQRKRSIIGIFVVVIFYIIMWLPCHVVHMWMAFHPVVTASTPRYIEIHTAANVLIFVNSSVNPYLYTLAGSSFRRHVSDIGHFCLCGLIRRKKTKSTTSSSREATGSTMMQ
ncbi:galanin receptor type 1-like [Amphiura filiformis]|uniref:galanin receptor type 1-like n=1 Tax=Amphiura filiformis TaxID=82378 RepID=UPI003B2130F7